MHYLKWVISLTCTLCIAKSWGKEKVLGPSHLMIGPGLFDVDRDHPKFMGKSSTGGR